MSTTPIENKPVKLTTAQKREMKILVQLGSITTSGYGSRHLLLRKLALKGFVIAGHTGHENVFRLTELGKTIKL